MLSALLGVPVDFVCIGIEGVEFLRNILPFVARLRVLP